MRPSIGTSQGKRSAAVGRRNALGGTALGRMG
jgi:hypothetical protein